MTKIPFCKPFINDWEKIEVDETLNNNWLTTGPITEEVEEMIAKYTGAEHCVLLNSGTAALHLSLEYLRNKHQKLTAYLPSLTFAATATTVVQANGNLIFGDVDSSLCLKSLSVPGANVAIPVHLCGVKADTDYNIDVVEDSAHLMERNQCKNSTHSFCYSFYATKNYTMGEGGALCTNSKRMANWARQARHHGISKDGWKRYQGSDWRYDIEFIGWKYNPSDVLASILKQNLKKIDVINEERQRCVALYNEILGNKNTGLHLYPILVKNRDKFIQEMWDNGIQCSVHFLPLHRMTAFKGLYKTNGLSNTEYYGECLVSLPLYPGLTNNEIKHVCETAKKTNLLL
jgi:dTDP-4-amino-4,6-dideoxygalactose transaminase